MPQGPGLRANNGDSLGTRCSAYHIHATERVTCISQVLVVNTQRMTTCCILAHHQVAALDVRRCFGAVYVACWLPLPAHDMAVLVMRLLGGSSCVPFCSLCAA
jgi:hypothetical protein